MIAGLIPNYFAYSTETCQSYNCFWSSLAQCNALQRIFNWAAFVDLGEFCTLGRGGQREFGDKIACRHRRFNLLCRCILVLPYYFAEIALKGL